MAGLGEVAGEVFLGSSSTIGKAGVVTVVELVGTGHWIILVSVCL